MKIIGVTGGIGAGKTTVSAILKEMGAEVIDADHISRMVTQPGEPAWKEIVEHFGEDVLLPDDTIDRKKLGHMVFNSEEKRRKLEKIIHNRVIHEMKERIKSLEEAGYDGTVVLDVPIPVREGFLDIADTVWVVVCPDEERIRRVMTRSKWNGRMQKAGSVTASQEDYIKLADVVIENHGDLNPEAESVRSVKFIIISKKRTI